MSLFVHITFNLLQVVVLTKLQCVYRGFIIHLILKAAILSGKPFL